MKIFKYTAKLISDGNWIVDAPLDIKLLRFDYVDDGFYKGQFAWGIVNPDSPTVKQVVTPPTDTVKGEHCIQMAVRECQTIIIPGHPYTAGEIDGFLYVYYLPGIDRRYTIVTYKTGQEILIPVDKLKYLGLCRLWIMQELGLYTFMVESCTENNQR